MRGGLWGGPPGPRGTPWSRCANSVQPANRPTRGSAADQGVRLTIQCKHHSQAGLTLMEVLIAVSLLSLLSVGMTIALRVGLSATAKANARLIDDRRVAGTQRILEQEIAGFMPVKAICGGIDGNAPGAVIQFFQGEAQSMRFVSTYSLQQAWRGLPQILEFLVIPRPDGKGVRLVVNEHNYSGPLSAGKFCIGPGRYAPVEAGPTSFVLADSLAFCRFSYLAPAGLPMPAPQWLEAWMLPKWPMAIRVDMAPFQDEASRLRPVTITSRIRITRSPEIDYVDQ